MLWPNFVLALWPNKLPGLMRHNLGNLDGRGFLSMDFFITEHLMTFVEYRLTVQTQNQSKIQIYHVLIFMNLQQNQFSICIMDMALCWDTSKNVPSLARAVSPVEPENMTAKFHVVYFYHSFANIIIILDIVIFCKSAF